MQLYLGRDSNVKIGIKSGYTGDSLVKPIAYFIKKIVYILFNRVLPLTCSHLPWIYFVDGVAYITICLNKVQSADLVLLSAGTSLVSTRQRNPSDTPSTHKTLKYVCIRSSSS